MNVRAFLRAVEVRKGMSLESAVVNAAAAYWPLACRVMDEIGLYPSSEPALRALQTLWPSLCRNLRLTALCR